jgi:hypothetical protein
MPACAGGTSAFLHRSMSACLRPQSGRRQAVSELIDLLDGVGRYDQVAAVRLEPVATRSQCRRRGGLGGLRRSRCGYLCSYRLGLATRSAYGGDLRLGGRGRPQAVQCHRRWEAGTSWISLADPAAIGSGRCSNHCSMPHVPQYFMAT